MNYIGGKFRQGKHISNIIHRLLDGDKIYMEPFCGAMGSASAVNHDVMSLSDTNPQLIRMWNEIIFNGVELPDVITNELYDELKKDKNNPNCDWLTTYVGFGMSFGGKWFGGYARNGKGTDYTLNLKRSTLLKRSTSLKRSTLLNKKLNLLCCSYDQLVIPENSVIYCDPPYRGRTPQKSGNSFDHDNFWDWARNQKVPLLVSEFVFPDDFVVVHNFGDTVVRHSKSKGKDGTNEVLVCHESQFDIWSKK